MNGYRDSKWTDVAYISEYVCAEWNDETECGFVGKDIEVNGSSEVTVGDETKFDQETFYVDKFNCPGCGFEVKYLELNV